MRLFSPALRSRCIPTLHPSILVRTRAYAIMSEAPTPVDEEQEPLHLTFMEEPLGLPASKGYGYYQGRPGDLLGPGRRFKLEGKLAFGMSSSVWLARDMSCDRHVAMKILTGNATRWNRESKLRELQVLQRLSSPPESCSKHCIRLIDHFYQPGIDLEDGEHLCLATELMSASIASIREAAPDQFIPIPVVKRMLRHLLLAIADMHARGIAHTDLKPDNIMADLGSSWTTASIDAWLKDNPPRSYPPEQSLTKIVTSYVSQSLPPPSLDTLISHTFKLADFGSAQIVSDQTTDDITPLGLRPPEIILGGEWNESVDIWTYGCLVFNFVTGNPLFKPLTVPGQTEEDTLLYQMICFCGEFFEPSLLQRCSRSRQYFDSDCRPKPKQNKEFFRKPFQKCILDSGFPISPEDIEGAASLMAKALRLDPRKRATAQELLGDPWLAS